MAKKKAGKPRADKQSIPLIQIKLRVRGADVTLKELENQLREQLRTRKLTLFRDGDNVFVQIDSIGRGPGPNPRTKIK